MWLTLALPLLTLPALMAFTRWEQRVMSGPVTVRPRGTGAPARE